MCITPHKQAEAQSRSAQTPALLPPLAEAIVTTVQHIPRGFVASYSTIGAVAGCGSRYVGRVMADYGELAPWWRVVRADGTSHVWKAALPLWDEEGIAHTPPPPQTDRRAGYSCARGPRVDMRTHAWCPPDSPLKDG
ncbi:MGMT family protein [Corynebacterium glucuronolyticum]|uniref:MGMT family protein n=1 Tax=Corynebacterium glucuronolyticum TaxID=39791 RepID=UPI0021AE4DFA|nr:MGMT family protein [Corynebacterium glucuronolyticum]MCT1562248.1 MGMT family protein [Corynebacterium glucuronolyticum]